MSAKATKEMMERLHRVMAEEFVKVLEEGMTTTDKDSGEIVKLTPSPAMLNVIRQFLKDNGIEGVAADEDSPLKRAADLLAKEFPEDAEQPRH